MIIEPRCSERKCAHYVGIDQNDGTELSEKPVCIAFPEGIPREIAYGDNPHAAPVDGQGNNIVYEASE